MMLRCPRCGHRNDEEWPYWLHLENLRCPQCWKEGLSVPPVKAEPDLPPFQEIDDG